MSLSRGGLAFALSLGLTTYVLYHATYYGTLSGPLQWDDCIVILRGFYNLDLLVHASSLIDVFRAVLHFDIHAPLAEVQTMIGLLLTGGQAWGPYLLNAAWLSWVLAAVFNTLERRSWTPVAAVAVLVLLQPLTCNALSNMRADWLGGLLLGGSLFLLIRSAEAGRADWRLLGSLMLGLSTLSKLTAFYLPLVAGAAWLLIEWYAAVIEARGGIGPDGLPLRLDPRILWRSADWRPLALRAACVVGPFILFFTWKLHATLDYIRFATRGVWKDGLTTLGRAHFYGPFGPDSGVEWGNLHIFAVVFVAAALLLAWRRRDRIYPISLLILAAVGAMLWIPLVAAGVSNHSFAATFLGAVLAIALVSMVYVSRSLTAGGNVVLLVVTVLISLPVGLPLRISNYYSQFPVSAAELRQLADTYGRIVDVMVENSGRRAPHVVVCFDHVFAPHPNLAIGYFRKTGRLPQVARVDSITDLKEGGPLSGADFVLTIAPDPGSGEQLIPGLYPDYPISHDPARAEAIVRSSGGFDFIGAFAVRGGEIHLYRH